MCGSYEYGAEENTYLTTSSMTLVSDSLSFLLRSFLFFAALASSGLKEDGRTPFQKQNFVK